MRETQITRHYSAELQTTTRTLRTAKYSIESTYSDFPCHLKVDIVQSLNSLFFPPRIVQSLNSLFFPPRIGAEPGRAKRESWITCMSMLRTNQSKITRLFFNSRSEEKTFFFDVYIVVKTNWNVVYRGLYSYRQRVRVITLFPTFFRIVFACWASLQKFLKGKSDAYN